MINRRQLIGSGTAASVLAALVGAPIARVRKAVLRPAAASTSAMPVGWDTRAVGDRLATLRLVLFDERFAGARQFGKAVRRRGLPVLAVRGDVTEVWYSRLHPLWRREPAPIGGFTTYSAMFCLERLAWDHGLRMTRLGEQTEPDAVELHSWIILPKGSAV